MRRNSASYSAAPTPVAAWRSRARRANRSSRVTTTNPSRSSGTSELNP
jgi:hypothetical protein